MPEWWPALVFGWPPVVVSAVLAVTGTALRKPTLVLTSVVLLLPFSYYLTGAENWMALAGLTAPITLVGSAYALNRRPSWVAWGLLAAFAAVLIAVAVVVA